jgi:hypothetical protein
MPRGDLKAVATVQDHALSLLGCQLLVNLQKRTRFTMTGRQLKRQEAPALQNHSYRLARLGRDVRTPPSGASLMAASKYILR